MAEVEYKGIKVGGSKLLLILPLLGTLIGGLWGGFELYNRLLIAEKKLNNLNPATIEQEIVRLTELTDVIKENLQGEIDDAVTRADKAENLARTIDGKTAETQREIRNDVYEMEREMQDKGGFDSHRLPAKGNHLDHDLLFGDQLKNLKPTSTPARIWRINPQEHLVRLNELIY